MPTLEQLLLHILRPPPCNLLVWVTIESIFAKRFLPTMFQRVKPVKPVKCLLLRYSPNPLLVLKRLRGVLVRLALVPLILKQLQLQKRPSWTWTAMVIRIGFLWKMIKLKLFIPVLTAWYFNRKHLIHLHSQLKSRKVALLAQIVVRLLLLLTRNPVRAEENWQ